jgi:cysteine synthase
VTTILSTIGNTPLVQLQRVVPDGSGRILIKIEGANPTGSKKDRMAREVIRAAEDRGDLKPGQPVVEFTGGSTGTSLALACAATGHPLFIVSSDAFSREKRDHMIALGATVEIVPSDNKQITQDLIKAMIARSMEIARETGAYPTDQLNNPDATHGYHGLGEEIWEQAGGYVNAYVDSIGTAHGILGVAHVLRPRGVEIIGVEPAESPIITEGNSGAHRIEGMGLGFIVPAWNPAQVDRVLTVSSDEAHRMTRRLAAEEGVFAGASTGANVVAALRVAAELGTGRTVATVAVDTGLKYLSTEVYRGAEELAE